MRACAGRRDSAHSVSTGVSCWSRPGASRTRTGGLGDRCPVRWTTSRGDTFRSQTGCGGVADRLPHRRAMRHSIPGPTRTGDLLFRKQPRFPAAPRGHAAAGAAVAGRACQGRDSNPQWPVGRRLYGTLRCLLRDPGVGVTDAVRTRSLRDHSPALYLVELQPPYSAKESNLFVSRV